MAFVVVGDAVSPTHGVQVGGALWALTHWPPLPLHAHPAVVTLMPRARTSLSCSHKKCVAEVKISIVNKSPNSVHPPLPRSVKRLCLHFFYN
ncbi:hypothetical protein E2C01_082813 [Portunus trituberculatus]|uniref:Uncharacterized protein n=1 Tax=Portunus trituberculatus TaxID=210409 RepID=A0A5B7IQW9_PORTR|nr:hypothetical protein [Portunus trituberculatus]